MSEIKALEKLREKIRLDVNNPWSDLKGDLLAMCDKVEREIAERYIELPVDADGVPIRLGDVMDGVDKYDTLRDVTGEVIEVSFNSTDSNECVASVALQVWSEDGKSWHRAYMDDDFMAVYVLKDGMEVMHAGMTHIEPTKENAKKQVELVKLVERNIE